MCFHNIELYLKYNKEHDIIRSVSSVNINRVMFNSFTPKVNWKLTHEEHHVINTDDRLLGARCHCLMESATPKSATLTQCLILQIKGDGTQMLGETTGEPLGLASQEEARKPPWEVYVNEYLNKLLCISEPYIVLTYLKLLESYKNKKDVGVSYSNLVTDTI